MSNAQHLLRYLGIRDLGYPWVVRAHRLRRKFLRSDERLCKDYLRRAAVPKLHIGGGWYRLEGWLNTDLALIPGVMIMDATTQFPFADETFQFIYSEHMIEHISYDQAAVMLRECYRTMRKGGVIRITTPDLATIAGLCTENPSQLQQRYVSWFCQTFISEQLPPKAASVINAQFRLWGHKFLYDEEILRDALCAAGFHSVTRLCLGNSDYVALQNLENTQRYPEELLDFESMALEACR